MQPIDTGDLAFDRHSSSLQKQLFNAISKKIVSNLWAKGGKLPSTRKLASELSISRNTVISVYEQLVAEGFLESRVGSGFYVAVELPSFVFDNDIVSIRQSEGVLSRQNLNDRKNSQSIEPYNSIDSSIHNNTHNHEHVIDDLNRSFAPGVPDLKAFPMVKWSRFLQRHASRTSLLGSQDLQGDKRLCQALCDYVSSSRSVSCSVDQIIITSGAQQALSIALMSILKPEDKVLMENPGYVQMKKVIALLKLQFESIPVEVKTGLRVDQVKQSDGKLLYVTPSNQYPMGTSINLEQRIELVQWAKEHERWIIEDDYDSEFQFAHRPYPSLQGLSKQVGAEERVFYVGSLSKVMFNGLRLGYLIVPKSLVPICLAVKDALSGDTPSHVQAALADFIVEGDFLRHIRKMRRLYKKKHEMMIAAIEQHFAGEVEVISQAAGLHVTLKWSGGVSETELCDRAKEQGITIRPLSMYESNATKQRTWSGAVLGFGNIAIEEIDSRISTLAQLWQT
ncbi:PLP-dependent aminotransferase family protein [Vibrio sp. ZSDE26]|uniref:PLP-dependent aminotransferase family protein n=1 Tax=Vibrio amylolyticus TaxID=2847292 RepID=A0A9X1XRH9_9VIBR|nr:PLP-dependent aminotransferase family protein [Vibrio amylolyticus]MCK6264264.1 PLP-dependent aminotransferase family protein [Vibrio amylolyticus]